MVAKGVLVGCVLVLLLPKRIASGGEKLTSGYWSRSNPGAKAKSAALTTPESMRARLRVVGGILPPPPPPPAPPAADEDVEAEEALAVIAAE
jgi:hypothetical protein